MVEHRGWVNEVGAAGLLLECGIDLGWMPENFSRCQIRGAYMSLKRYFFKVLVVGLGALLIASQSYAGPTGAKCTGSKIKSVGKAAKSKSKCHSKATKSGEVTDPDCLDKASEKFTKGFAKAEAKPPCFAFGDAPTVEADIDTFVGDLLTELRPVMTVSKCSAAQLDAAGKEAAAKLNCHSKAAKKGINLDAACITKAEEKYSTKFAKSLDQGDCLTAADAVTIEAIVNAFVDGQMATLRPGFPSDCTRRKLNAAGGKANGALKCHGGGAKSGDVVSAGCLATEQSQFDSTFSTAEGKGDCIAPLGDAATVSALVDAFVMDVEVVLRPVPDASGCALQKLVASGREADSKLKCRADAIQTALPADDECLGGSDLLGFAEAEAVGDCLTLGDAATIESLIDTFVDDAFIALTTP